MLRYLSSEMARPSVSVRGFVGGGVGGGERCERAATGERAARLGGRGERQHHQASQSRARGALWGANSPGRGRGGLDVVPIVLPSGSAGSGGQGFGASGAKFSRERGSKATKKNKPGRRVVSSRGSTFSQDSPPSLPAAHTTAARRALAAAMGAREPTWGDWDCEVCGAGEGREREVSGGGRSWLSERARAPNRARVGCGRPGGLLERDVMDAPRRPWARERRQRRARRRPWRWWQRGPSGRRRSPRGPPCDPPRRRARRRPGGKPSLLVVDVWAGVKFSSSSREEVFFLGCATRGSGRRRAAFVATGRRRGGDEARCRRCWLCGLGWGDKD